MVFYHNDLPEGPNTVHPTDHVRVLAEKDWTPRIEEAEYDFVYILPAGLSSTRWLSRLKRLRSRPRIVLDLDPQRKFREVTDILHCEAPRDEPLDRPHIVALPHPASTAPPGPTGPIQEQDFYLTVFTPYNDIKGHREIPAFLEATGKRLVWCFDPQTFTRRKKKHARRIYLNVKEVAHPLLERVEAPSREEIYGLYHACAGYISFSSRESLGYSMLDAVLLGKPLCSRRTGVCHSLEGFKPTDDFSRPVFGTYAPPVMHGFGALFQQARKIPLPTP